VEIYLLVWHNCFATSPVAQGKMLTVAELLFLRIAKILVVNLRLYQLWHAELYLHTPLRQNSCRLKFLKKIKFEIRDENVYKVF